MDYLGYNINNIDDINDDILNQNSIENLQKIFDQNNKIKNPINENPYGLNIIKLIYIICVSKSSNIK